MRFGFGIECNFLTEHLVKPIFKLVLIIRPGKFIFNININQVDFKLCNNCGSLLDLYVDSDLGVSVDILYLRAWLPLLKRLCCNLLGRLYYFISILLYGKPITFNMLTLKLWSSGYQLKNKDLVKRFIEDNKSLRKFVCKIIVEESILSFTPSIYALVPDKIVVKIINWRGEVGYFDVKKIVKNNRLKKYI